MQVKETLRMHTPNPFGLPRIAPEGGLSFGDHHFKEGVCQIHLQCTKTNHSTDYALRQSMGDTP
jgi:hypothetical protein